MNRKLVLLSIALLTVLMISAFPAKAWVQPDGSDDSKSEVYGPHIKGILVKLYTNEENEWNAMDNDEIDFEDWPLTAAWIEEWQDDPRFQLVDYGGEAGYMILDMNHVNTVTLMNGDPNPAIDPEMEINVMSILSFRQALACLVDRSYIVNTICDGLAQPMYTPIPTYMSTYVHPDIVPLGTLDNLTYGGYTGDVDLALQYFEDDGFLYNAAEYAYRFYDINDNGHYDAGEEFTIIFYSRSDSTQRFLWANAYDIVLEGDPVHLDVDYRPNIRQVCSDDVFGAKQFHLYTGGWIYIGPDPDYLYDLYHSSMYEHPGKPSNYDGPGGEALDEAAEDIKFATDFGPAQTAAYAFQFEFANTCFAVPLWCASGKKAFRVTSVEEGGDARWVDVVNQQGTGVMSWWTFLNVMKECEYYPDIYAVYGFMSPTIEWRNPIYAQWYWDWEFIGKIYDSCAARNPYDLGEWVPQLAQSWETGTWIDPNTHEEKSKVRVTLRPDLKWSDGYPITVADIAYTFIESVDALLEKGLPTPWWYSTVQYMRSFYIIDALNIEILLDVKSVFAVGWVIGTVIIPKHIWKPLVDASTVGDNVVYGAQPDPLVIGSGPFLYVSYTPYINAVLDANPLYYQTCPVKVLITADTGKLKFDPGYPATSTTVDITVSVHNVWLNDSVGASLIVDKFVYIDGALVEEVDGLPLFSCTPEYEHFDDIPLTKCKHNVTVAVHIVGPAMVDDEHANPWICQWIIVQIPIWVTIKQDIGGASYQGAVTVPDCKVDGKDIAYAASAFNTVPGQKRWNSIADITGDYKVDGKDIANIAKYYGKW